MFVKTLTVTLSKMHVTSFFFKHLLLLNLNKLIRTNKLFLLTETQMRVACFSKTPIVILSKEINKNK